METKLYFPLSFQDAVATSVASLAATAQGASMAGGVHCDGRRLSAERLDSTVTLGCDATDDGDAARHGLRAARACVRLELPSNRLIKRAQPELTATLAG